MVGITDVELVSSYSCVGSSDSRKIVVPGLPARWVGLGGKELVIKPDTGVRALDQNAIRWPASPMEPAICAVLKRRPDFDFTDLDLISDRRALGSLLDLASDSNGGWRSKVKDFSFGAVLVGKVVIFVRTDDIEKETTSFNGCRYNFEEHALQNPEDFQDSKTHQRIIRYKIGALSLMLRYSADGYMASDDKDLAAAMATYQEPVGEVVPLHGTTIETGGALLPQSAMLDLVTRVKRKNGEGRHGHIDKKLRGTYLSGMGHFMAAEYWTSDKRTTANFERLDCHFSEDNIHHEPGIAGVGRIEEWEERNQDMIQRFHDTVLDTIDKIRAAAEAGEGSTYMVTYAKGKLGVLAAPARIVPGLPEELCERIKAKPASAALE